MHTILYADMFDYPLTKAEIWKFLISQKTKWGTFTLALDELFKTKKLIEKKGFVTLSRRQVVIKLRQKREQVADKKLAQATRVAKLLGFIPMVWFVGVSGALAMRNAPEDDDIDLFIITAPGFLWTTRLLTVLFLTLLGLRRLPRQTYTKDTFCLNMFMSADTLKIPRREQDLYSAHEIVQLIPLFNRHQTHETFVSQNFWVRNYLPHATHSLKKMRQKPVQSLKLFSYIEHFFYQIQKWYMNKKHTKEIVLPRFIRFHPNDQRLFVLSEYAKRIKGY